MKIYYQYNVLEAAIKRFKRVYQDFEHITISSSGGKDSAVIMEIAVMVARELNRLPVDVLFFDQEAEWTETVEYFERLQQRPEIKLHWYQVPFKIFNAGDNKDSWLKCWAPGEIWMREKNPKAIHENLFGCDRFVGSFEAIAKHRFNRRKHAYITGMRAKESTKRSLGVATDLSYKDITWGLRPDKKQEHYVFHPIYDWEFTDVWKFLFDGQYDYNEIYNKMYQHGERIETMRVSNLNHVNAIERSNIVQRIDPELYDRLTDRLVGMMTVNRWKTAELAFIKNLPPMFETWKEYRDYLVENLIDEDKKPKFYRSFTNMSRLLDKRLRKTEDREKTLEKYYRICVRAVTLNDYHGTLLKTFETRLRIEDRLEKSEIGQFRWNQLNKHNE